MRAYGIRAVNALIVVFVDVFRALPPLVAILLIYFGLPNVGINLPSFAVLWLVLSFVLAAFAEEIFWAGITSTAKGQWEAARSTGLGFSETLALVVLPQAIRNTLPGLGNYAISMFKETPFLFVISVVEMFTEAQKFGANTFSYIEPLTMVGLLFLLVSYPTSLLVRRMENRLA